MDTQGPRLSRTRMTLPLPNPETGLRILIVDPDFAAAERLAMALRPHHLVTVVGSAHAALANIATARPHLLVTEIDLPDANGVQLIARVHTDPVTRHMLLMIVTGRRSVGDKIAGLQAGADDYLVKPVDPFQFVMHVRSVSRFRQVLPTVR